MSMGEHPMRLWLALSGLLTAAVLMLPAPASAQPTCGQTITQDVKLEADLDCFRSDGYALKVGAPGVTIDLGGHSLYSWQGILNQGYDGVTIRNGYIGSEVGSIRLEGVERNVVSRIETNGLLIGITVVDSDYNRFVDNRVTSLSFRFSGSDHNVVARNVITRYESSLWFSDSSFNRIVDNVVWTSRNSAFGIYDGSHNTMRRNTFVADLAFVVGFRQLTDSTFADNRVVSYNNWIPAVGAEIEASSRNVIARNEFNSVPQGLRLHSGSSNVIRDNALTGFPLPPGHRNDWPASVPDGIVILPPVTGTRLVRNTVQGFDDDGIDVEAPNTSLRGNTATNNGDLGIEAVAGVSDLGGNSASGNGNPLQCVNVFCQ
jgi:Periplasmic copper-binding protein (NosD)